MLLDRFDEVGTSMLADLEFNSAVIALTRLLLNHIPNKNFGVNSPSKGESKYFTQTESIGKEFNQEFAKFSWELVCLMKQTNNYLPASFF